MWIIAGVLLGLLVLASLVGFHTGPHAHFAAGVIGVFAAAWLVFMAVDGRSAPVLWALLSADVVVSVGVGILAWNGLWGRAATVHHAHSIEGSEGLAVGDLTPRGIVRVGGEDWSAVSVNGNVSAGGRVHVLRAAGLRLDVWGEDIEALPSETTFSLDEHKERNT
jgi:membrane-bound ClpP family serine protease